MRKSAAVLAMIIMLCAVGCNSQAQTSSVPPSASYSAGAEENALSSSEQGSSESKPTVPPETTAEEVSDPVITSEPYTRETRISDVISDPVFGDYGRLIFPVNEGYYSGETLGDLRLILIHNHLIDKILQGL